jgi:hypothetical protein
VRARYREAASARFATLRGDFGVATECGMGREPREAIGELLDLHREAASL